jgi:hypothetical protein
MGSFFVLIVLDDADDDMNQSIKIDANRFEEALKIVFLGIDVSIISEDNTAMKDIAVYFTNWSSSDPEMQISGELFRNNNLYIRANDATRGIAKLMLIYRSLVPTHRQIDVSGDWVGSEDGGFKLLETLTEGDLIESIHQLEAS